MHDAFDHKEYEDGINLLFAIKWSMFFIKMGFKQTQRFNSCFENRHDKNVMHWWISTVYEKPQHYW